jgi:hypothetical protein
MPTRKDIRQAARDITQYYTGTIEIRDRASVRKVAGDKWSVEAFVIVTGDDLEQKGEDDEQD